jgi:cell division protein FtsB
MIKPGETFYRLVPDNKRAPGSTVSQNNLNQ